LKVVVQRAKKAKVIVNNQVVGAIDHGLMILVGVTHDDTDEDIDFIADKLINLRIFEDADGKMNLSLLDVGGNILSVSQFTLYADTKKGRRPSYIKAARPEHAEKLYNRLNEVIRENGINVETGIFGAMMDVEFTNEGPVTIILESESRKG